MSKLIEVVRDWFSSKPYPATEKIAEALMMSMRDGDRLMAANERQALLLRRLAKRARKEIHVDVAV